MKNVNAHACRCNRDHAQVKLVTEEALAEQAVAILGLPTPLAGIDEAKTNTKLNINHRFGDAALQPAANHSARRRDKINKAKIGNSIYISNTSKISRIFRDVLMYNQV